MPTLSTDLTLDAIMSEIDRRAEVSEAIAEAAVAMQKVISLIAEPSDEQDAFHLPLALEEACCSNGAEAFRVKVYASPLPIGTSGKAAYFATLTQIIRMADGYVITTSGERQWGESRQRAVLRERDRATRMVDNFFALLGMVRDRSVLDRSDQLARFNDPTLIEPLDEVFDDNDNESEVIDGQEGQEVIE